MRLSDPAMTWPSRWRGYQRRYWATACDSEQAQARVISILGPIAGLSADNVRAMLAEAVRSSPHARISLAPRTDSRLWRFDAVDPHDAVEMRSDLDTADLGRLLTEISNRPGGRQPLEVLICGEYLTVDYSHGLGDGRLGATLTTSLAEREIDACAASVSRSLPRRAVWAAIWRNFVLHPSRAMDVVRLRKGSQTPTDGGELRRIDEWRSARRCVSAYMDRATVSGLRSWASDRYPGASAASVTVALWAAALRAEGQRVDDRVMILVDCRRYFAPKHRHGHGNFASGVPILVPHGSSPFDVAGQVRRVTDACWPLARLGIGEVKTRPLRLKVAAAPTEFHVPDRIRLSISDVGKVPVHEDLAWVPGGRPPQASAYIEPDGPDAVALLVTEVLGTRTFTVSFCDRVVEPSVVDNALKRMCDDPVGLLQALG